MFPFFQAFTLFILASSVAVAAIRWRGETRRKWRLSFWIVALGFALGFGHSLNPWLAAAGAACSWWPKAKWAEIALLAYVVARCVGLLAGWADFL